MIRVVRWRWLLLNVIAASMLIVTLACAARSAPQPRESDQASRSSPAVNALPEGQGVIDNCNFVEDPHCTDRLKVIADAGFTLVLNYNQLNATPGQELLYADEAEQLGLKII